MDNKLLEVKNLQVSIKTYRGGGGGGGGGAAGGRAGERYRQ